MPDFFSMRREGFVLSPAGFPSPSTTIGHRLPSSNHIKFNVMTENMITDDIVWHHWMDVSWRTSYFCFFVFSHQSNGCTLKECIQTGITGPPEPPKTTVQESFVTLVGGTKVVVVLLLLLVSSSTTSSSSSFFSVSSVGAVVPSADARNKGEEGVAGSKEGDVVGEVACVEDSLDLRKLRGC